MSLSGHSNANQDGLDPVTSRIGEILNTIDNSVTSFTGGSAGFEQSLNKAMSTVDPFFRSVESWIFGQQPGLKGTWDSNEDEYVFTVLKPSKDSVYVGTISGNAKAEEMEKTLHDLKDQEREILRDEGYMPDPSETVSTLMENLKAKRAKSAPRREAAGETEKGHRKLD